MISNSREVIFSNFECSIIGITSGCFDLLHPLHIQYLEKCRRKCDALIVFVDGDDFISSHKNPPTVINEDDRVFMISSLKCVDCAKVIESPEDFKKEVREIIDLLKKQNIRVKVFKNSSEIYGEPVFQFDGAELVIIEGVKRFSSTTEIKESLKNESYLTK